MFPRFSAMCVAMCVAAPLVTHAQQRGAEERVSILPDQGSGTATVAIDGVPVLRVTSATVYVSGNLVFSGVVSRAPMPAQAEADHAR